MRAVDAERQAASCNGIKNNEVDYKGGTLVSWGQTSSWCGFALCEGRETLEGDEDEDCDGMCRVYNATAVADGR